MCSCGCGVDWSGPEKRPEPAIFSPDLQLPPDTDDATDPLHLDPRVFCSTEWWLRRWNIEQAVWHDAIKLSAQPVAGSDPQWSIGFGAGVMPAGETSFRLAVWLRVNSLLRSHLKCRNAALARANDDSPQLSFVYQFSTEQLLDFLSRIKHSAALCAAWHRQHTMLTPLLPLVLGGTATRYLFDDDHDMDADRFFISLCQRTFIILADKYKKLACLKDE